MNQIVDNPIRNTKYTTGEDVPRDHVRTPDNSVDTFRILFRENHEIADLKNVLQQFHEVIDLVDDKDKIFTVRIRSISGLSADSVFHTLNPFYPIETINHTHVLTIARKL